MDTPNWRVGRLKIYFKRVPDRAWRVATFSDRHILSLRGGAGPFRFALTLLRSEPLPVVR